MVRDRAIDFLLMFDKLFIKALSSGEPLTRKSFEDFFGVGDGDVLLKDAARLGVDGIVKVLNDALARMRSNEASERRACSIIKRHRRHGHATRAMLENRKRAA